MSIFEAWSDEPWVSEGAAVRVSLICFGPHEGLARLDGREVAWIYADLTATHTDGDALDLTTAKTLAQNKGACIRGLAKVGKFDVVGNVARSWLSLPNPHGKPNSDVLTPWSNGLDITRRPSDTWLIDFKELSEGEACLYEEPFVYVAAHVKSKRLAQRDPKRKEYWWRLGRSGAEIRSALSNITRYIATPMVAKHRLFVWMHGKVFADQQLIVIARADDATFGILHSRFHELWSLRLGTWLGVGNDPRYTPTTTFETFPFPPGLAPADTARQRTEALDDGARIPADLSPEVRPLTVAIAAAAHRLNALREAWLNPPEWVEWVITPEEEAAGFPKRPAPKPGHEADLKKRTMTALYNARPAWLDHAHQALDAAVAAAYGWTDYTPDMPDEEILRRLLALNLERHAAEGG